MPPTDVTTLIRTELHRLAGSLRKVGELILEDPAAVTHCSAAELGRRGSSVRIRVVTSVEGLQRRYQPPVDAVLEYQDRVSASRRRGRAASLPMA